MSTTFCISQGDRNWPFLMLTGLFCEQAATMKLVCRQRNAGVCSTSTTAATSASGVSSCTSVSTGTPICSRTRARILRPSSMPGPRKLAREERLALSKEALNMKGMPSAPVISFSRPATSSTSASLSMTQGPAIRKNGRSGPTSTEANFMRWRGPGCRAARYARAARDEAREQRVAVARRRGELGMKLAGDEPGMRAQFDELHQAVRRKSGETQARGAQFVEIVIVEFIAVAMALEYRFLAVNRARLRSGRELHFLRPEPHAAAHGRISRRAPAGRAPGPAIR